MFLEISVIIYYGIVIDKCGVRCARYHVHLHKLRYSTLNCSPGFDNQIGGLSGQSGNCVAWILIVNQNFNIQFLQWRIHDLQTGAAKVEHRRRAD